MTDSHRSNVVKIIISLLLIFLFTYVFLYLNGFYFIHNKLDDCSLIISSNNKEVQMKPLFLEFYAGFTDTDGGIYRTCEGRDPEELLYVSDIGIYTKF